MSGPPLALEDLLAQSSWLRRLARSLVAGEDAAEDLVQETWLAALRHPPADGPARPWLARVARRLAANFRRGEARRRTHETAASAIESADPRSAAEVLDMQRVLVEAVLRLSEPLRTTVTLRYVQGLDSPAIGRRQGVPAGTVRWRLKRALELLRADLDQRSGGERERWLAALAPWIGEPGALAGGAATAIPLAKTGVNVGLALGGLLALFVVRYVLPGGVDRERPSSAAVVQGPRPVSAETPVALRAAIAPAPDGLLGSPERTRRESTPRVGPPAPPRRAPLRGRLWIAGTEQPLDEVLTLELRAGDLSVKETVVSAPDGSFASTVAFPRGIVLATVLRPPGIVAGELETFFEPAAGEEWRLAVSWPTFVSLRVVDRDGAPLLGVRVTLAGEGAGEREFAGATHKLGEVRIDGLIPGYYALALQRGFAHGEGRVLVARGPNELGDLELRGAGGGEIRGEMRCPDGEGAGTVLLFDLEGELLARAGTRHAWPDRFQFVFTEVPPGDYRLVPLSYDGRHYEPESMRVSPPETDLVFEARGTHPVFQVESPDLLNNAEAFVRMHGRWFGGQEFAREDVERWLVLATGHKPSTGDPPASGPAVPHLEPGWGHALFFVEVGAEPDFLYDGSSIAGNPLAGVEVRADGRPVATSDASGLALLDLEAEPEALAFHKPGWLVQAREKGDFTTVVLMRRN